MAYYYIIIALKNCAFRIFLSTELSLANDYKFYERLNNDA